MCANGIYSFYFYSFTFQWMSKLQYWRVETILSSWVTYSPRVSLKSTLAERSECYLNINLGDSWQWAALDASSAHLSVPFHTLCLHFEIHACDLYCPSFSGLWLLHCGPREECERFWLQYSGRKRVQNGPVCAEAGRRWACHPQWKDEGEFFTHLLDNLM